MLDLVNLERLHAQADALKETFRTETPFKHIAFDGLFRDDWAAKLAASFPDADWDGWNDVDHEHQRYKRSCTNISVIPDPLARAILELNSGPFLRWIESVTGLAQIQPDPHLIGGGLHMTLPGGTLTPHTDFHIVNGNPHFRRLNLIVYLNADWHDEDLGRLELWDRNQDVIAKEVDPVLNRSVMFQTDDKSVHGFSKPVANKPRQSIAMYYYTAYEADEFSGDGVTYWRTQTLAPNGTTDRFRLGAYRACLAVSRVASALSWRAQNLSEKLRA